MTIHGREKTNCYWDAKKLILKHLGMRPDENDLLVQKKINERIQSHSLLFMFFLFFFFRSTCFSLHTCRKKSNVKRRFFTKVKRKKVQRRRTSAPFVLQSERQYLSGGLSSVSGVSVDVWHGFCLLWFVRFNPDRRCQGASTREETLCSFFLLSLLPSDVFPSSWRRKTRYRNEFRRRRVSKQVDFIFIIAKTFIRGTWSILAFWSINIAFSFLLRSSRKSAHIKERYLTLYHRLEWGNNSWRLGNISRIYLIQPGWEVRHCSVNVSSFIIRGKKKNKALKKLV